MNLPRQPEVMPPFPDPLEYLWRWFQRLSRKRQNGMEINGLDFRAIEAFAHLNQVVLHNWELRALEDLDEAVMAAWRSQRPQPRSTPSAKAAPEPIPVSNVAGIKALLRGLKARKAVEQQPNG